MINAKFVELQSPARRMGHLEAKQVINLDFADVTFADRTGLALLLRLRAQGVKLVNCSPFIEEELRAAS